jgi:hypothetical protein
MGRPNQCNPCCGNSGSGGSGGSVEPPISDCEKVICVAFIDENNSSLGGRYFQERMVIWKLAYPERFLFVLDVSTSYNTMYYPEAFKSYSPRAFSLRREFDGSPTGLIRHIQRDNGSTAIANSNNPWQRIKTIVNRQSENILQAFNSSREVAISIDNSGSMTAVQVAATVEKLKQDAINDQKIITQTIINEHEDVVCPFVRSGCDTGHYSQQLLSICSANQGHGGEGVMA